MHLALDPAAINGDLPLNQAQRRAYLDFHRDRNATNAALSTAEGIETLPPTGSIVFEPAWSPARHDVAAFFRWAADRARLRFGLSPISIIDLGCGGGFVATLLADAGIHGDYLGIDLTPRASWSSRTIGGLRVRFLQVDIALIPDHQLPAADFIVSATALEHIEDDHAAITRLTSRLSPHGMQAHFVPGEAALDLYGPHGWRQYSPRCLRALFPNGDIYRYGGPGTNRLHTSLISRPTAKGQPDGRARHPHLYELALLRARQLDAASNHTNASMYGVFEARPEVSPSHPASRGPDLRPQS
jgi:SAM-dependent methyltransferase